MNTLRTLQAALVGFALLLAGAASADPGIANAKPKTEAQKAMLKVIDHWRDTYNNDVDKMIADTHAKDATVMFNAARVAGHEQFLRLEKAIKAAAPGRMMRVDRVLFVDDQTAVVEAVILDKARPDFFSPWIALLTIRDGKIVQDRTYLEPHRWPGIEVAAPLVTAGGLGDPTAPPPKY